MNHVMLTEDDRQLWEALDATGKFKGNFPLIRQLDWDPNRYWKARGNLLDRGLIDIGRGRGGSIKRAFNVTLLSTGTTGIVVQKLEGDEKVQLLESSLYEPIKKTLELNWPKYYNMQHWTIDVTAFGGSRETGGKWSRPDIGLVSFNAYDFVPGRHFEVTTFEVKKHDAIDVTAVYEAVAHLRKANSAYVILQIPPDKKEDTKDQVEEVFNVAIEHGIGLIIAEDMEKFETWDIQLDARFHDADPYELERFIQAQMSSDSQDKIRGWFSRKWDSHD